MNAQLDLIADGLADQGYAVADGFLSTREVSDIRQTDEFRNHLLHFRQAGIGQQRDRQVNEAIRGDYIRWIDPAQAAAPLALYVQRLRHLIEHLNRTLYVGLKDFEIHQTVYPVGTFYKRHLDQFKKDDHRKLSVICYLNEAWHEEHGGQLRLYVHAGHRDVLPLGGRLVCFRSEVLEHEVLPATRERFSLTGWLLNQHAELKHL
ncbi:MAG: 2OG-Fe(II) oxygenase [Cyclobacteriaceae bacterium]|jgi:SM-20-related protein|nr:2OG-Fe(II) oxygenase [Cyclobacteriaceae bacterium]